MTVRLLYAIFWNRTRLFFAYTVTILNKSGFVNVRTIQFSAFGGVTAVLKVIDSKVTPSCLTR